MKNSTMARKAVSSKVESAKGAPLPLRSRDAGLLAGKALRATLPRERHAVWRRPAKRRDPINVLRASNEGRLPELVPIRYGRMLRSPFTFLRGSAGLMASDLATTPTTGLRVQACGDCHLMNFGLFATPERNLVFDMNDFDETLPAPWEWDLKRLAVSFVVAARDNRHSEVEARDAAVECVRSYREHLRALTKMTPLQLWYDRLDEQTLMAMAPDAEAKVRRKQYATKARQRVAEYLLPKMTAESGGHLRLTDQPPVLFHPQQKDVMERAREALEDYRLSLAPPVRALFDRYRLEDMAVKVVGIGSVGTRCLVGLFVSADNQPLLLQFKEECPSVLAPYAGPSVYKNQGERVVMGQRLIQCTSDIFLGWTRGRAGFHFFGRQLRDMKFSLPVEGAVPKLLKRYAELCGWTLARAHAKSGDGATISGYLGKTDAFDQAIGRFAIAYADQNEKDHAALVAAVKTGRIEALVEEDL
jgi:uncharacterized protein (DUF2252 family)